MKIDILTLFPSMFDGFVSESIIKRAISAGKVSINIHDIREYSKDPHKKVDDYGYGGIYFVCKQRTSRTNSSFLGN